MASILVCHNAYSMRKNLLNLVFIHCAILIMTCSFCLNVSFAQTVQTFTVSGSWYCPPGVTSVTVETWGGGGSGGGVKNTNEAGGGGGGGAYNTGVQAVVGGTVYNYVVGSGGIGSADAGLAGGLSSFNALTVANGGGGGGTGLSGTGGAGGAGGIYIGGAGAAGVTAANSGGGGGGAGSGGAGSNAAGIVAGAGGTPNGGSGGTGLTVASAGITGNTFGGGGSGALTFSNPDRIGGNGAGGRVRITYTCGSILTNTATVTTAGTASYNWTALSWSLGHVPNPCEDAVLIINNAGAANDAITIVLNADISVNSFQMQNISPGPYVHILQTSGSVTMTTEGNMTITAAGGNKFNRSSFANQGNTFIKGNLVLGRVSPSVTEGHSSIGSTGSTPNQTYTLYGNMSFNPRGYVTDEWAKFIFDKAGTQYLYNNTTLTDTTAPVLFETLVIGNANATTLIYGGTAFDSYIENVRAAGVTIGINSTLDLPANYSMNKFSGGFAEPFNMLAGSKLRLGGDKSIDRNNNVTGVAGSNFPASFNSYNFNATSTVEYYGSNAVTQTVYAVSAYAHLEMTNGSGSGRAQKITAGVVTAATSVTINALADLTLGAGMASTGPFNVVSAGGLWCAANVVSGANTFTLNNGSYLGMGHALGISVLGTATGNIQMTTARNFSNSANYIYNGAVNQVTGNALPAICNGLTIANTAVNGTVTIAANQLVNGVNLLQQGTFDIGTTTVTINGSGTLNSTGGFMKANRGIVNMNGNSGAVQSLAGSWFTGRNISTLINSNTAGITIAATVNDTLLISSALLYGSATTNSVITTNDNLTLLSRDTATARFGEIVTGSGNTITGKVNVERYISSGRKWRHLSFNTNSAQTARDSWMEGNVTPNGNLTPGYGCIVTDQKTTWSANNFDSRSLSGPSVKYYDPATDGYIGIPNTAAYQMASQSAYYNYVRGDRSCLPSPVTLSPAILRTKGTLISGDRVFNVAANQFAAIGNPYASAIDIRKLDTAGLGGNFYVWDPKLTGVWGLGAYQTLYQSGTEYRIIPGGGSYGPLNSFTDTLESGQAFFVKAWSVPGTLTFKENAKNIGARTMSFAGTEESAFCMLSLSDPSGKVLVDGAMAAFGPGYNNEVGNGDAMKMANTNENISFKRGGKLLVIERRANNTGNDTLFLNITGMRIHQYQWDILTENMMTGGRDVYFIDNFLSTSAQLNLNSNNPILFEVTSIAGSYAPDRFMIVFTQQAVVPVRFTGISAVRNSDKAVTVKWHTDNEINMKDYTVEHSGDGHSFVPVGIQFSLTGNGGSASYSFIHTNALSGINYYRVKGTGNNGQVQYTDIVKLGPLKGGTGISVYPNPVANHNLNIHFENQAPGKYNINVYNSIGQRIRNEEISILNSNTIRSIALDEHITSGSYSVTVRNAGGNKVTLSFIVL